MKKIGIISNARLPVGIILHKILIEIYQKTKEDKDFPYILHFSYPFSENISKIGFQSKKILSQELQNIFISLKKHKPDIICMTCHTLHFFIKKNPKNFLDLIKITETILKNKKTLILCSSTSRESKIHAKTCNAIYLEKENQTIIDEIIKEILSGKITRGQISLIAKILKKELSKKPFHKILLGSTELSLLHKKFPLKGKDRIFELMIVDPLIILAKKLSEFAMR